MADAFACLPGTIITEEEYNQLLEHSGDARYTKCGAIVHCFIVTVHCCVLCDATQGSLSLGISNITRTFFVPEIYPNAAVLAV